jgi:hypothetical protein
MPLTPGTADRKETLSLLITNSARPPVPTTHEECSLAAGRDDGREVQGNRVV